MFGSREFPSLSNNAQNSSANQSSLWSTSGSRNVGPIQRNQPTPISSQPSQQDDMFSSSVRLASSQGSFRFGGQGAGGQAAQPQPGSIDDFPPLNNSNGGFRNGNGEIGQERGPNLMSQLGFGAQSSPAPPLSGNRAGNGLLSALSANTRASDTRSPDAGAPGRLAPMLRCELLSDIFRFLPWPRYQERHERRRTSTEASWLSPR